MPNASRAALRIALWQAVATLVIAGFFLVVSGGQWALSALAGGGIAVAASLAMIGIMFRGAQETDPRRVMTKLYAGEAVKLALTIVLFVGAIRFMHPAIAPLLIAYIATLPVYWLALLRTSRDGMS
ncbi:MAG TPA: ATP synthase subunit I [Steroidobacteraceae bacterium]